MRKLNGVEIEGADEMTDIERLEAAFKHITNSAISNLQNELEVAGAMRDADAKKLFHVQIGMFRHAQSIFDTSRDWALRDQPKIDADREELLNKLRLVDRNRESGKA